MTANNSAAAPDTKPSEYGANSPLTYNHYLKVPQLKELQICQSDPAHHDEPLFIIIHQTYELWFKLILHELDEAKVFISADNPRKAAFYLKRVNAIMKVLVNQIHILETMAPRDFLGFRHKLNPASGFQSSQFREIEFVCGLKDKAIIKHFVSDDYAYKHLVARYEAPSLRTLFFDLLARNGVGALGQDTQAADERATAIVESHEGHEGEFSAPPVEKLGTALREAPGEMPADGPEAEEIHQKRVAALKIIYDKAEKFQDMHDLAEQLIEVDELITLWRTHHMTVVERVIGYKRGTGGSEGVAYLRTTVTKRCFPEIWQVRTVLELDVD